MKPMKKIIMTCIAWMACSVLPALAQSQPQEQALKTVQAWMAGVNQHQLQAIGAVFAQDAVFFGTSSKTPLKSQTEIKQYFEDVFSSYSSVKVELGEHHIRELGAGSAVLTGFDKWTVSKGEVQREAIGRLTIAVAQRQGQWLIVGFQRSALPN
jgi:uncharacterized protein (TIGR02246 family)